MRHDLKISILASVLAAAAVLTALPAEAGGAFGMHIGTSGFGVSVGVGDWSPYTQSWANPGWTLDFNATLSGYGEWVWVGNLGRVWRPWVAVGWRPYTYGRWVRTTLGWTWVAYEPWGYVPHHYGSWAMCDFGWVWVPGYSYSSANVVWVRSGGYVGWYARPPWGWSHSARSYRHGYRDGWNDARYATYVDWHHMSSDNVSHYAVRHTVAARHRVEDHAAAPTVAEVRRRGGVSVTEARLSQRTVSMEGRRVTVARPEGVARSIEHHASGTAAAALAPRALERRQPSVRSVSTSPYGAARGRSGSGEQPSDRRYLTGTESRTPDRLTRRSSTELAERGLDARTEHSADTSSGRRSQSPRMTGASSSQNSGPSHESTVSGRVGRRVVSIDSRRDRMSKPDALRSASTPSAPIPVRSSARGRADSSRSARGTESAPHGASPRIHGPVHRNRETAAGTRSTRSDDDARTSGAPLDRRRRAAPKEKTGSDSDTNPARRSPRGKKR
jgi:hypothetical protein